MRQVFDVNVFSVVAVTNVFLPLLRRAEAARIVNLSSEVGSLSTVLDPASRMYALTDLPCTASKTALNMVTGLYAKELAGTAIKVSAAIPGYCATDLNDHTGLRSADDCASAVITPATLPADAPTGQYWGALFATGQNGAAAW
ncbi:SDR family NAD(P)-dependent oxidoreductase [Nonomuraea sp. NPDC051941]|uniref:SDR family NAD(P)-dependent oxidoreductase n=1 Tax=Nonomuraea sp. NPDC051941 TaxID=3364373 RepID=UPI0037C84D02